MTCLQWGKRLSRLHSCQSPGVYLESSHVTNESLTDTRTMALGRRAVRIPAFSPKEGICEGVGGDGAAYRKELVHMQGLAVSN